MYQALQAPYRYVMVLKDYSKTFYTRKEINLMPEYDELLKYCPRCRQKYTGWPAISRVDNRTEICSNCGDEESKVPVHIQKKIHKRGWNRMVIQVEENK